MGFLVRLGFHGQVADLVMLARKREAVGRPALEHQVELFFHARFAAGAPFLVAGVFFGPVAGRYAEDEAPFGDIVQHGDVLRGLHRPVQRQQIHAGADGQRRGTRGHGCGRHQQGRTQAVVHEVVLDQPRRVEADLLGDHDLFEHFAVELSVGQAGAGRRLHRERAETEAHHGATSFPAVFIFFTAERRGNYRAAVPGCQRELRRRVGRSNGRVRP